MVLSRSLEPPDLIVATLSGVVTLDDQQELVGFVRASIAIVGSVRLLVRFERFTGWVLTEGFADPRFWLRDDEGVSRIAVVAPPEWRRTVETVVTQPVRRVPIAWFPDDGGARRWLAWQAERPIHTMAP